MDAVRQLLDDLEIGAFESSTADHKRKMCVLPTLLLDATEKPSGRAESACERLRALFSDLSAVYRQGEWDANSATRFPSSIIGSIPWVFADDENVCFLSASRASRRNVARTICRCLISIQDKVSSRFGLRAEAYFIPEYAFVDILVTAVFQFGADSLMSTEGPHGCCSWMACFDTMKNLLELLWLRGFLGAVVRKVSSMLKASTMTRNLSRLIFCVVAAIGSARAAARSFSAQLVGALGSESLLPIKWLVEEGIALPSKIPGADAAGFLDEQHSDARNLFVTTLREGFSIFLHTLFFESVPQTKLPREVLRFLIADYLPRLASSMEQNSASNSSLIAHFLQPLMEAWCSENLLYVDEMCVLDSRCNAVMYALPLVCRLEAPAVDQKLSCLCSVETCPSANLIGYALKGSSNRFEAFRPDMNLRKDGALVATALSRLLQQDSADAFEEFPNILEDWEECEPGRGSSTIAPPASGRVVSASSSFEDRPSSYPINPDGDLSRILFLPCRFATSSHLLKQEQHKSETLKKSDQHFSQVGVVDLVAEDPLHQLRHAYEQLMGLGDASLQHETECEKVERLSQAMRSLPQILQKISVHSRNTIPSLKRAVEPLIHPLFTALFGFSHSFSQDSVERIADSRTQSALLLFSISATVSLQAVSSILHNASTSVSTKSELCRIIGQAVEMLSAVPVPILEPKVDRNAKILYPPIKKSTIITGFRHEGSNTRRWGNTAHVNSGRCYSNEAAEIASDVLQAFFVVTSSYSFERDDLMFVPVEMLRSVSKLFVAISLVRHVVSPLAADTVPFLVKFTAHALPIVRAHAWIALDKVLSSWRGASVAPPEDWTAVALDVIALGKQALGVEKASQCLAAIVEALQTTAQLIRDADSL